MSALPPSPSRMLFGTVLLLLVSRVESFVSAPSSSSRGLFACKAMKGSVYIAVTVDGFIATPDGDVSFLEEFPSPEGDDMGFSDFLESIDVLIMGRKTFEKVMSFGPDMWAYGKTRVIVWSRSKSEIPYHLQETVTCSSLSPTDLFTKLEDDGHKHAYVDGGLTIQKFLEANLIRELKLTRVPLLLGGGIPLFGKLPKPTTLQFVESKSYVNGMVTTTYRVPY